MSKTISNENTLLDRVRNEIEKLKEKLSAKDAIARLEKNADYQLIFEKMYFDEHLKDSAKVLAVITSQETIEKTQRIISGIGSLRYFLDCLKYEQNSLQQELYKLQEMEQQILAGTIDENGEYVEESQVEE